MATKKKEFVRVFGGHISLKIINHFLDERTHSISCREREGGKREGRRKGEVRNTASSIIFGFCTLYFFFLPVRSGIVGEKSKTKQSSFFNLINQILRQQSSISDIKIMTSS